MQKEREINKALRSLEINKTWMVKYPMYEDLYQIAISDLYRKFKDDIIAIFKRDELQKLFRTIVLNNVRWKRSRYGLLFHNHIVYSDKIQEPQRTITPAINLEEECKKVSSYWYDQYILKEYAELGTIAKVSELTGIPNSSVRNTIRKLKKEMQ